MSVDKTIEELSYTLAQLGTLVSHINAQVIGITSRINTTLETFDSSVAGVALDASALTHQVGVTVSQIPDAWVFYLLFITLIVVFILLSIVLTINLLAKCHGIYRLVREPKTLPSNVSRNTISEVMMPVYDNTNAPPSINSPLSLSVGSKHSANHIAIPMEYEPRRVGYPLANGDVRCDSHLINANATLSSDDTRQSCQKRPLYDSNSGRYNAHQTGLALPLSRGEEV